MHKIDKKMENAQYGRAPPETEGTERTPADDVITIDEQRLFVQENDVKVGEEEEEGSQGTNLETLLAAWWKYKRENKQKKKKRKKKILKIYRDENYWNDGRYTDNEDFNYYES